MADNNEKIIAALVQHGTIKDAAKAAGVTPRNIYDKMNDRIFLSQYNAAKNEILRAAVFNINSRIADAIDNVAAIMNDTSTNPATRLQAAQTILNTAIKFTDRLNDADNNGLENAKQAQELDMFGL